MISPAAEALRRLLRRYGWLLGGIALLLAVSLLPPDTSLAEIERSGRLTACLPPARPPLVTGDPAAPGLEVELLAALADELGVRLAVSTVPAMAAGFNPRSWQITRARCAVIAGGLLDTPETRAFLAVGPAWGESGWLAISPADPGELEGRRVGVLVSLQGADRVALAAHLRAARAETILTRSTAELAEGLATGAFEVGVAEGLVAAPLAAEHGWATAPLPPPLAGKPLVIGLWKGDLTLKRAIERAFAAVEADGRLAAIRRRYLAG